MDYIDKWFSSPFVCGGACRYGWIPASVFSIPVNVQSGHAKELVSACFFLPFYVAITVQFEQNQYMVQESDGKVDIRVIASERTSFPYTFTVTSMDITATSKLIRWGLILLKFRYI